MIILLATIVIFIFMFLFEVNSIISGETVKNIKVDSNASLLLYKIFHLLCFVIMIALLYNIYISISYYYTTRDIKGMRGDRGIPGLMGKSGRNAKCSFKCGQKICYGSIKQYLNKIYKKETGSKENIKNIYFMNHLNKICNSKAYDTILRKQHKNQPNEKKLINYIKKHAEECLLLILKHEKGKDFLSTPDVNFSVFPEESTPLTEIKKYDIWSWGDSGHVTKPIIRKQCTLKSELPKPDDPPLKIVYTNNYRSIYNSKVKDNIWGPSSCPNNQLGESKSNPKNLKYCISKRNNRISYLPLYKSKEYKKSKEEVSLYHPNIYTSKKGNIFYPVGSVWRGKEDHKKPINYVKNPGSNNICDTNTDNGPGKETILISGDIKSPKNYKKIWSSKTCKKCQDGNDVSVWRPVAPSGYTCLGDVVIAGQNKPSLIDNDYVKCVPSKCVEEEKLGKKVWDSKGMGYKSYINNNSYIKKKSSASEYMAPLTLWQSGSYNAQEEYNNRENINFDDDNGYNLFRSSNNTSKPNIKKYTIKGKCLYHPKTPSLYKQLKQSDLGLIGGTYRDSKYSIFTYYEKSPLAIVHSMNETGSLHGSAKAYYLQDAKTTEKNEFYLKAYSKKTNKFSSCLTAGDEGEVVRSDKCDKSNKSQLWIISLIINKDGERQYDDKTGQLLIKLINKSTNKCFKQSYNKIGKSTEEQVNFDVDGNVWRYKSVVGDVMKTDY